MIFLMLCTKLLLCTEVVDEICCPLLTVSCMFVDVFWSELMERCRTPPRCRSPSITRRSNEPRKHHVYSLPYCL